MLIYSKPEIYEAGSLEELRERRDSPGVFYDEALAQKFVELDTPEQIMFEITNNRAKYFTKKYGPRTYPFGSEDTVYSADGSFHVDFSKRILHLCTLGAVYVSLSEIDPSQRPELNGAVSLKQAYNNAIRQNPPNDNQITTVSLSPGMYIAFNGIYDLALPFNPHQFVETKKPRLSAVNY